MSLHRKNTHEIHNVDLEIAVDKCNEKRHLDVVHMYLHSYKDSVHKHDLITTTFILYTIIYICVTYVHIDFHKTQDYIHNKIHHYFEYIGHYYHKDY